MFLLAVMAGGIQILVAVCRLGDLTRYISASVVIGFMAGAGLLIALTQVGNLLGLKEQGNGHQHLLLRLWLTLTQGGAVNPRALAIGLGTALARGAAAEGHASLPIAAIRHAHGPGDRGGRGRHVGLVAKRGPILHR